MTNNRINIMIKQALAGAPSGGNQFQSGGVFNKPLTPNIPKPVTPKPTPVPEPPKTPNTYDQSTQVSLPAPAAPKPPAVSTAQPPAQGQQAGGATTSGNPLTGLMNGGLGSTLKGMLLPASGSNQDMGAWFGSPIGRMMRPMVESSGPMALPAIAWMQQMMNGDMSRWNTLTSGAKKTAASLGDPDFFLKGKVGPNFAPLFKGPSAASAPVSQPAIRIPETLKETPTPRADATPEGPAPELYAPDVAPESRESAPLQKFQQDIQDPAYKATYTGGVPVGQLGLNSFGANHGAMGEATKLLENRQSMGVWPGYNPAPPTPGEAPQSFYHRNQLPINTAAYVGGVPAAEAGLRSIGVTQSAMGKSFGQMAGRLPGASTVASSLGRPGAFLGGQAGRLFGPAGLAIGGGLELADIGSSNGGFQRAFGQEGQQEFDQSTSAKDNGYALAALNGAVNPIRSTYAMNRHLIYDPHARDGRNWFPALRDLYNLVTSGNLGLLLK